MHLQFSGGRLPDVGATISYGACAAAAPTHAVRLLWLQLEVGKSSC